MMATEIRVGDIIDLYGKRAIVTQTEDCIKPEPLDHDDMHTLNIVPCRYFTVDLYGNEHWFGGNHRADYYCYNRGK